VREATPHGPEPEPGNLDIAEHVFKIADPAGFPGEPPWITTAVNYVTRKFKQMQASSLLKLHVMPWLPYKSWSGRSTY